MTAFRRLSDILVIWFGADAKKQIQQFASQTVASHMANTLQSAFSV